MSKQAVKNARDKEKKFRNGMKREEDIEMKSECESRKIGNDTIG